MTKAKLLVEYQGFLKFLSSAKNEILNWFGPYCNHDPLRIVSMSAKEWDAMADEEKRYFIRAHFLSTRANDPNAPKGKNPYMSYLLHKRYNDMSNLKKPMEHRPFNPKSIPLLSSEYRELTQSEREMYAADTLPDIGIKHVLEKRDKLHQMFEPKELHILEYIIRTMPHRSVNARAWYVTLKGQSIRNPNFTLSWQQLEPERKRFFEDCSQLDRKRYRFEKNVWTTQLLQLDLEDENISLDEFVSHKLKSNREAFGTIIEYNKDVCPISLRSDQRPTTAFALFVKDYVNENGSMSFSGDNVKRISKAWWALPEEEREKYKQTSKSIRESYCDSLNSSTEAGNSFDLHSISKELFKHTKATHGPTKPSHLYSKKLPTLEEFYAKENKLPQSTRHQAWQELDDAEKNVQLKRYEAFVSQSIEQNQMIEKKLAYIQKLVEKAKELLEIKKGLRLIRKRRNEVKNMYLQTEVDEK